MARSFNGSNQACSTGTLPITVVNNFSMGCWVNLTSVAFRFIFCNAGTGGNNTGWSIYSTTVPDFGVEIEGVGDFNAGSGASANTWTNLVYTRSSGTSFLYVNGTAHSLTTSAPNTPVQGSANLTIGCSAVFTLFTPGSIADCACWTAALSAGEISAFANGARPGAIRPLALTGWWPLDGLQSPEPDLSGNANNVALTNGPTLASGPPISLITPRWPQKLADPGPAMMPELQNFNAFVGRRVAVIGY